MHRGWVRLYRKLADNPLWTEEKFTHGQAWIDLILIANYRKGHIRVRGVRVDIDRGQVAHSEKTLAERWKWSKGKVRRFLFELQDGGMVVQQKSNVMNLITIINYDEHQTDGNTNGNTDGKAYSNTDGLQTVTQTDTNKKDKKVNKVKKDKNLTTYSADRILIIEDFNTLFNAEYMPNSEALVKLMDARLKEGHTVEHFKTVHRNMKQAWENDTKMSKFLRPQTLYTGKFSSYMNYRQPIGGGKLSEAGQQTAQAGIRFLQEEENAE